MSPHDEELDDTETYVECGVDDLSELAADLEDTLLKGSDEEEEVVL